MKSKRIIVAVLLGFVTASVVFAIVKETTKDKPLEQAVAEGPAAEETSSAADVSPHKVILYYFHGNARCPTCMKFESYSREVVKTGFQNELEGGRLKFRIVNVDEPGNAHYVEDYKLYTKSLVLVEMKGDEQVRWSNLDKIWDLVGSKETFVGYVQDGLKEYLQEK
jgi:hypothetical protein